VEFSTRNVQFEELVPMESRLPRSVQRIPLVRRVEK
jgi:hypothetical protein